MRIDRLRLVWSLVSFPLFFAFGLFLPAGTWNWERGWFFVFAVVALGTISVGYLWRVNPELVAARINSHQGTKPWDKILFVFILITFLVIFPVAALDDGRFHWLPVPEWVCALGYGLLVLGVVLITRAQAVNKFFEPTVRIQADRGQRVIDTGPYAIVRHPGYVSCLPLSAGVALSLGSIWALIPAGSFCLVMALRTLWEDQTLRAELAGYEEYTRRVRYRWLPGCGSWRVVFGARRRCRVHIRLFSRTS
ncbi:hypothetical protein FRUB_08708 [Fimbriiglobus ruber]|uniref:Isoprenylcysteine carboxyl methyltransferase n=1 Tax=Fimbriiglobus ruber TaxID=1908690 RepID=A0A225DIF0_9BACT|nr:hypothetical protein FRUB_08708 [Fimbriiglobus ruber]